MLRRVQHKTRTIRLASPELIVFLHELAHAVDDHLHGIQGGQIAMQEVVAEFSAAVITYLMCYKTDKQENQMDNQTTRKRTPVKEIAAVMRVIPRRVYQIKKQYEEIGKIPELKQPGEENPSR